VDILCPDYKLARFSVRVDNKLYDSDDHRFAKFSKQDSTTPSNGGASQGMEKSAEPSLASFGSGFIITKSGYLVTNYHVIEGGRLFKVRLGEDLYQAEYVKHDSQTDLAVLKVSGTFNAIKMSANRIERLGREVFVMGFPQPTLQGFSPKITKGVISSGEGFKGDVREYQIDATVQPGNSGGPLADKNGNLVGLVVASLKRSQNVNYAVKKSYLLAFLDSIPECSSGIETAGDGSEVPFEDAVAKVQKSCVQILVYK
jgi:S1-C subfamily serine protease